MHAAEAVVCLQPLRRGKRMCRTVKVCLRCPAQVILFVAMCPVLSGLLMPACAHCRVSMNIPDVARTRHTALRSQSGDGISADAHSIESLERQLADRELEIEQLRAKTRELEAENAHVRAELSKWKELGTALPGARHDAPGKGAGVVELQPCIPGAATFTLGVSREPKWWHPTEVQSWLGARPIGRIRTSFPEKNGTPRQGCIAPASKARLAIEFGNNPHHSLEGLEDFSHVWLLFLFHDNGPPTPPRAKIKPPRLGGATKGIFATRAPHRPNPIGLTLCQLQRIGGNELHLSGVDLVDGTPILDIKPFIPSYDAPHDMQLLRCAPWGLPEAKPRILVEIAAPASADLQRFLCVCVCTSPAVVAAPLELDSGFGYSAASKRLAHLKPQLR
jgi:tRNA-Thr(GGU) m(6)t(6)A37 methyltransferase TsaA